MTTETQSDPLGSSSSNPDEASIFVTKGYDQLAAALSKHQSIEFNPIQGRILLPGDPEYDTTIDSVLDRANARPPEVVKRAVPDQPIEHTGSMLTDTINAWIKCIKDPMMDPIPEDVTEKVHQGTDIMYIEYKPRFKHFRPPMWKIFMWAYKVYRKVLLQNCYPVDMSNSDGHNNQQPKGFTIK